MSEEKPKNIKALIARLAILPTIIGLRRAEMDTLNVLFIGAWVLWLIFDAVLTVSYRNLFMERVTKSATVRLLVVGVVVFATGWIASLVHGPSLTDPESTENKYVRVTRIPNPNAKSGYATLLEFGVRRVNSEGFRVCIRPVVQQYRQWYGMPGRSDPQTEITFHQHQHQVDQTNPNQAVLWIWKDDFTISPRRSYYLYLWEREPEEIDILYFAVASNPQALLASQRERIGHQYRRVE
jgi:hypothetical protein